MVDLLILKRLFKNVMTPFHGADDLYIQIGRTGHHGLRNDQSNGSQFDRRVRQRNDSVDLDFGN